MIKPYQYKGHKIWITKLSNGRYTWSVTEDSSIQSWSERDMKDNVRGHKTKTSARNSAIKDINKYLKEDKYGNWYE